MKRTIFELTFFTLTLPAFGGLRGGRARAAHCLCVSAE
jgi:hypothetical protein